MIKKMLTGMLCIGIACILNAQQVAANSQPTFTLQERNAVIDILIAKLDSFYVYQDVAKKMAETIRLHRQNHDYDTVTNRQVFATILTAQLQAISKDGHLGIDYSATPVTNETPGSPSVDVVNQFRKTWAQNNFNFKKVEVMEGNIGFLQLNTFFPAEWIKDLAQASMTFLANSDAVIIDLRNNHGFAPDGVLLVESYFFDDAVHLEDEYDREAKTMQQTWTMPIVPGTKLGNIDLYILVSKNTFSAPEDFAYNLQSLGRAKVVGEVTGGGAHGTKPYKIGTYFTASIPFRYGVNTVTHTDWEGKGIQPDVKVPADQALLTAQIMAIRALIKRIPLETKRVAELERIADEKEKALASMRLKEGK
jgi:retinol-binding protein 3